MLAGFYIAHRQPSYSLAQDESQESPPAQVMLVDDPGEKTDKNQEETTSGPQPIAETIQKVTTPPEPRVVDDSPPPVPLRRRSAEQARNAWRAKPVEQQAPETDAEPQEQDALVSNRKKFGRALSSLQYKPEDHDYEDAYQMGRKKISRSGKNSELAQRINGEFSQDVLKNYIASINRAICYGLNRQRIVEAYSALPDIIKVRLTINRKGELVDIELLRGSPSSAQFNERLIEGIKSSAPFRKLPDKIEEDPFTYTCNIYPREEGFRSPNRNQRSPIDFYFDGKGAY
jgi:hypothetical protein